MVENTPKKFDMITRTVSALISVDPFEKCLLAKVLMGLVYHSSFHNDESSTFGYKLNKAILFQFIKIFIIGIIKGRTNIRFAMKPFN